MRISHWTFACSLAAIATVALPAEAGPKGAGHERATAHAAQAPAKAAAHEQGKAHEAAEAHKKGKAAEAEGEDHGKSADDHGKKGEDEANKGDEKGEHGDHKGPPEAVQKKLEQLRETRKQRRAAHLAKIKQKWGDAVDRPAVRSELKVHAWRMARLNRIRELATAEDKKDVVARVDKLIEKEQARHDKHMDVLKKQEGAK